MTTRAGRPGSQHVAIYLRISKTDARAVAAPGASAEDVAAATRRAALTSLERQRTNCRRVAAERWPGLPVVEFVDDGLSASRGKRRAGLDALQEDVRGGRAAAVVLDTLDRLTRDRGAASMWALAQDAEDAGASIVGASQEIDLTTSSGELSAGIMAAAARFEARRMGDRIRAANVLRRSRGLEAAGGPAAIGQVRTADGGVAVDPVMGPVVADAAARIIAGTLTVTGAVAEWQTRDDVPRPPGGGHWTHRTVSRTLRLPSLAGMVPSSGDVLRGTDGLPVLRPGAVLSVDDWHLLQATMDERARTRAPTTRPRSLPLLHGLAVDKDGHRLYLLRASARGQVAARADYTCRRPGCKVRASVAEDRLDAYVMDAFQAEFGAWPETTTETVDRGGDPSRLAAIRRELVTARAAREAAERERDRDRARDLSARVEALLDAEDAAAAQDGPGRYAVVRETGRTLDEALAASDVEGRRRVLATYLQAVVVAPGRRGGAMSLTERVSLEWTPAQAD